MSNEIHLSSLSPGYHPEPSEGILGDVNKKVQEISSSCLAAQEYWVSTLLKTYEQNSFEKRDFSTGPSERLPNAYVYVEAKRSPWMDDEELQLILKELKKIIPFFDPEEFLEELFFHVIHIDDLEDVIYDGNNDEGEDDYWMVDCGDYYFTIEMFDDRFDMKNEGKYSVYHACIQLFYDAIKHRILYEEKLLEKGECKDIEWSKVFINEKGPKALQNLEVFDAQVCGIFIKAYNSAIKGYVSYKINDSASKVYSTAIRGYHADKINESAMDIASKTYEAATERAKYATIDDVDSSGCLHLLWERGFLLFKKHDYFKALKDMEHLAKHGKEQLDKIMHSDLCLKQGALHNELGEYQKAIGILSGVIDQDPENKEAYFERACAYFETQSFENALTDYLQFEKLSDQKSSFSKTDEINFEKNPNLLKYSTGLIAGLTKGSIESLSNFVPSILSSLSGLGHGLWSLCTKPKECTAAIIETTANCMEYLSKHTPKEMIEALVPELQEAIKKWDQLKDYKKGELIGFIIGRYGLDVLMVGGSMKACKALFKLKRANTAFTLKSMAKSTKNKNAIIIAAKKWNTQVKKEIKYLKKGNLKLDKAIYRKYRDQQLTEHQVRKILHTAKYKTYPKPKGIPENWTAKISKKHGGMRYVNPKNSHDYLKVSPGNPKSPHFSSQKPYVVRRKNGKTVGKHYRPVDNSSIEAHIPLDEYKFKL